MKPKSMLIALLALACMCILGLMLHLLINRNPKMFAEMEESYESRSGNESPKRDFTKFPKKPANYLQIQEMKKHIQLINERQHLINHGHNSGLKFEHTVLVIRVNSNISYLAVFFDSIRRIIGINKCLLIFAHDFYDKDINKVITTMRFARVLQIFYPYSIQLHPHVYPGDDSKFCHELTQCGDSKKRNPVLAQAKLFWWWVVNQVFDHIGVLKNYNGYIYLLETEMYLIHDFIDMAKMLEHIQPMFCPECRVLSLGARPPLAKLYRPLSSTLVISVWGWSNYSNSGFGFNRTTWNVIKNLKEHFCYFKDPSWENSLKHLASTTFETHLYMFYIEAPRFFPTVGCGAFKNGTDCALQTIYQDILDFLPFIRYRHNSDTLEVKFDASLTKKSIEPRGQWEDARDINMCMFFAGKGSRLYY